MYDPYAGDNRGVFEVLWDGILDINLVGLMATTAMCVALALVILLGVYGLDRFEFFVKRGGSAIKKKKQERKQQRLEKLMDKHGVSGRSD